MSEEIAASHQRLFSLEVWGTAHNGHHIVRQISPALHLPGRQYGVMWFLLECEPSDTPWTTLSWLTTSISSRTPDPRIHPLDPEDVAASDLLMLSLEVWGTAYLDYHIVRQISPALHLPGRQYGVMWFLLECEPSDTPWTTLSWLTTSISSRTPDPRIGPLDPDEARELIDRAVPRDPRSMRGE